MEQGTTQASLHAAPRELADFIRARWSEIAHDWENLVRQLPTARGLDRPALFDAVPALLDQIAAATEEWVRDPSAPFSIDDLDIVEHVAERFGLDHVIGELLVLRDCIVRAWSAYSDLPASDSQAIGAFNRAVDTAITASAHAYEAARCSPEQREREWQLQALADNIPQLAWMADAEGHLTWVNERWHTYSGRSPEEVVRDPTCIHHPDYVDRVMEKYERHIASGTPWEDTFPLRSKDGSYRWFLSRAQPIRDASGNVVRWFGTNTDVTEERFMSEATTILSSSLDSKTSLQKIAALAVPMVCDWCAIDLVERGSVTRVAVTHTDPTKVALAHELIRKYPPDWNAPTGLAAVIRTGTPELIPEITDDFLASAPMNDEQRAIVRQLGLKSVLMVPLVARDRILGAIMFVSAESGRRFTSQDLEHAAELGRRAGLAVDNARLYEESQRETRIREDVLAVVSHDLKNPLGAIHLAATMLLEQPDPRYRKHLETIYRAATRMDHLIGDLLDMASIQAGRLKLERRPEEADTLVREVADLHEPMMIEKGLQLIRRANLHGQKLLCDRDRVLQVFGNLLGNAIKFCSSGDQVTLRAHVQNGFAEFAIEDTGPGIPEHEVPHIFEPYWSGRRHMKKGSGLGLFITKGIIEAHQGRLWVESALGKGTTFYFTLPLA